MRLGLLADIHEAVESLQEALALFRRENVEQLIFLGDLCRMHHRLEETVQLLRETNIRCVWGNHDFGLCQHVDEQLKQRYSSELLNFMSTFQPSIELEDCYFSHVEPYLDPSDLFQLWSFDAPPQAKEDLARNFSARKQRVMFSGHRHKWYLANEQGPLQWDTKTPIYLAPPARFLVIMHSVVDGHCAVYDTPSGLLTPYRITAYADQ